MLNSIKLGLLGLFLILLSSCSISQVSTEEYLRDHEKRVKLRANECYINVGSMETYATFDDYYRAVLVRDSVVNLIVWPNIPWGSSPKSPGGDLYESVRKRTLFADWKRSVMNIYRYN